jgi:hypothetical protein
LYFALIDSGGTLFFFLICALFFLYFRVCGMQPLRRTHFEPVTTRFWRSRREVFDILPEPPRDNAKLIVPYQIYPAESLQRHEEGTVVMAEMGDESKMDSEKNVVNTRGRADGHHTNRLGRAPN